MRVAIATGTNVAMRSAQVTLVKVTCVALPTAHARATRTRRWSTRSRASASRSLTTRSVPPCRRVVRADDDLSGGALRAVGTHDLDGGERRLERLVELPPYLLRCSSHGGLGSWTGLLQGSSPHSTSPISVTKTSPSTVSALNLTLSPVQGFEHGRVPDPEHHCHDRHVDASRRGFGIPSQPHHDRPQPSLGKRADESLRKAAGAEQGWGAGERGCNRDHARPGLCWPCTLPDKAS